MRYLVTLALFWFVHVAQAQDWEDQRSFNGNAEGAKLRIVSSADTDVFAPFIDRFVQENPDIGVEYMVTGTADMDRRFRADPAVYDLVISSAMDLQLKLVNDGLAMALPTVSHPPWAQWRQSLFGFTLEPAAIVINRAAFAGHPVPKTRQELIQALRARPDVFRDRVGTYDIRQSGLGYLFATQDARASETYWRLMEVMGSLQVRLYCCSGAMIDDLSEGKLAVAYNVLGSYAAARIDSKDALEVILPSEFPTTMMRTAMVSAEAPQPEAARRFVQHLIRLQTEAGDMSLLLPPLDIEGKDQGRATIALEPALMTYLDALKRRKFLAEWEDAVIQPKSGSL